MEETRDLACLSCSSFGMMAHEEGKLRYCLVDSAGRKLRKKGRKEGGGLSRAAAVVG